MNTRNFAKHLVILTVLGLLAACGGGSSTPAVAPQIAVITAQPTDQSVVAGTTATFTVAATDANGYQWQRSSDGGTTFTDVTAATAASHTTPVTALTDSGAKYRVVVSGAGNSVTSSAVTLTVTPIPVAPGISVHPANQTITEGQNVGFSVTASGTSLAYQWQRSADGGTTFNNEAGATNATLTLTAVPLANNSHRFRVVVSNSVGSVTSNIALLTVNAAQSIPAFTTQPASQSVIAPNTATFSVAASGAPTPTVQWQLSTNAGSSFADIAGATGGSYTTPATVAGDNGNQYRVIATNTAGATTSNAATLTVTVPSAPSFTTHPANVTITAGQNAQFTVAVSGTPTPTLQWQLSTDSGGTWNNITGETGTVFNVTGAALANNGRQFRAVATNGSGTVNSNAAVLTVLPKSWGTAALIETDNTGHASQPQIAFDANGNALAVWSQSDVFRNNIWSNRYTAGSGWGTAALIETDDADDAFAPQIAFDASGNALAVWSQSDVFRNNIWSNRYTAGSGWGTAALIELDNAGSAGSPQIAFDASGNAIAVWAQFNGAIDSIWANRYSAGQWGAATLLETSDVFNAYGPQIVVDANGNAMAVWSQTNGAIYSIWANRYTASTTTWGTAVLIEIDETGSANPPQIAIDAFGNAMAVWSQSNGPINNIWANRFTAGTGWGNAALIETNNASFADFPQIAFDGSGNAMAVWNQYRPITYNRYTVGTGWGTAGRVDPNIDNQPTGNPQIAIDTNGNALAVWSQSDGTRNNIWANRFQ